MLLLILLSVNLPYQFKVVTSNTFGAKATPVDFVDLPGEPMPVMAGWPYRFLIHYREQSPYVGLTVWSGRAALFNLLSGTLVLVAFWGFGRHRSTRRENQDAAGTQGKTISIAHLLAFTLAIAAVMAVSRHLDQQAKAEIQFAQKIVKANGSATLEAWAPAIFDRFLYASMRVKLRRIRAIRMESPDSNLLGQILERRNLRSLRIGGDNYDLSLLQQVTHSPHLCDVRIAGRMIDDATLDAVTSNSRIHTLNFMRTNLTASRLQEIGALKGLQRLNIVHTDVKLSEIGKPKWSACIREAVLPHPEPGGSDKLSIEDWPNLETLVINELDTVANHTSDGNLHRQCGQFERVAYRCFSKCTPVFG